MDKLKELLTSRKALSAIGALLVGVWGYMEGDVSTEVLMGYVTIVVGFWQQAQSKVDAAKIAAAVNE